jgi:MFS family permease
VSRGNRGGRVQHARAKSGLPARFWQLWSATAISSTGDGLVGMVALPLLALTMTKDPVLISGVWAANRAAAAVFSLPAGVLTDHRDRRAVMVASELVPGVALAGLFAAMTVGAADLAMVYAVAVVISAGEVTYTLAAQAVFPELVPAQSQLSVANGRLMAAEAGGEQFVGPAVGGLLFDGARRLPFGLDAVSFFFSAMLVRVSLSGTNRVQDATKSGSHFRVSARAEATNRGGKLWRELAMGFRTFWSKPALRLLAAAMAGIQFSQNMVFGLLVIYGRHLLGLSSTGYGLFLAGAAVVGVAGLYFGGSVHARLGSSGVVVAGSLACALSFVSMSATRVAVLGALAFGLQEFGTAIANVGSVTTRQQLIPRELFGRVGSVHRLIVVLAGPFGALLGGALAEDVGVQTAFLVAGLLELGIVVVLAPAVLRYLPSRTPAGHLAR